MSSVIASLVGYSLCCYGAKGLPESKYLIVIIGTLIISSAPLLQ